MNKPAPDSAASLPMDLPSPDLLNALPDGVYITDINRRIVFWNKAAERITGWRYQDVVGRSCSDNILAHVDKDGHLLCGQEHCPLHRSMVTGQASTESQVVFARRKFGASAPLEISVGPVRDRDGRVIGGIEIFRDITEAMQDLLRAKAIQAQSIAFGLAPDPRVELAARYQPRELVGGDFYHLEKRDQDHYAVLLADAMGHGVAAALHTMELRSLWEEHRGELDQPARFLDRLNERLHGLVQDAGYFATAVALVYDAAQGRLRCVRAGHPAPLLFRRSGEVELVGPPQLALGMVPVTAYVESESELRAGDALLLYTDGALEVADSLEHFLGLDGLKRLVREQNQADGPTGFRLDQLEQQLLSFSDSIHLTDDLTLLKLRRLR